MLKSAPNMVNARLINLALIVCGILIALVLVEATLRIFKLYEPPPSRVSTRRPDLYQFDEKIGYRLWRSTATSDRYPATAPNVVPLVSNSDGFRSAREFDEVDSRQRILMIGDSFVFGVGVRAEERLTEVLESQMPGWRVDNLGMTGWGIDLMLRGLEHVGLKAQPDIIVLAVYTDDFRRLLPYYAGSGFEIPKYEVVDGALVSRPYPAATGWRRLHLIHVFYSIYWRLIKERNRFDLNEVLLDRFIEVAKINNSELVVLFIPGKGLTGEDRRRRAFLEIWAQRSEIPFLDLTDAIHSAGIDKTYIKGNWHWNATGHSIAASELKYFLVDVTGLALPPG